MNRVRCALARCTGPESGRLSMLCLRKNSRVLAGADFLIPCKDLFARAVESVSIAGPMLLNEARDVHLGFWPPSAARQRMHQDGAQGDDERAAGDAREPRTGGASSAPLFPYPFLPTKLTETAALQVSSFALRSLRDVRAGRLEVELCDPLRHLPAEDGAPRRLTSGNGRRYTRASMISLMMSSVLSKWRSGMSRRAGERDPARQALRAEEFR